MPPLKNDGRDNPIVQSSPDIRDMAQARHQLNLVVARVDEIAKFLNDAPNERKPRVMLSDGGNHYVELSIENVTGPDRNHPWTVLVQFLRAMQEGKGRIIIQLGRDQESRMTQLCPVEVLDKMIRTMKENQ